MPLRDPVGQHVVRFANSNGGLWSENSITLGGRGGGGGRGAFGGGPATAPATQEGDAQGASRRREHVAVAAAVGAGGASSASAAPLPSKRPKARPNGATTNSFSPTLKVSNLPSEPITRAVGSTPPRASRAGLVYAGDSTGGLAVAVKNFWQSYPSALEVQGLVTNTGKSNGLALVSRRAGHGHALV